MGSANLTENEIIMRYPKSIIEWEMKHGIVRYEKNGMLYVGASLPNDVVFESIRREREQIIARENMQKRGEKV